MNALKLRLIPDDRLPMLYRLQHEVAEVGIEEVLEKGVHPWVPNLQPPDIVEGFLARLNRVDAKPGNLQAYPFSNDLHAGNNGYYSSRPRFEQLFQRVHDEILFCEPNLDFQGLLKLATDLLRDHWRSSLVLQLAEKAYPQFSELRRFLKAKHPKAKLRGYDDLREYDWGRYVSLSDFQNHERLLIDEAVQPLNLRVKGFVGSITDEQGRLKMRESIDHLQLMQNDQKNRLSVVTWQAKRQGSGWNMRPQLGNSSQIRKEAEQFAKEWKRDGGKLCFTVQTDDIARMVETGAATPGFPGLRYYASDQMPKVSAQVLKQQVQVYGLGVAPRLGWHADRLKDILRDYEKPASGIKNELAAKIAQLAVEEYHRHQKELTAFFTENRFIRATQASKPTEVLPVLNREDSLTGLLLRMYLLRHLRGNVLVDPTHQNDSTPLEALAEAILYERVDVAGALLRVG